MADSNKYSFVFTIDENGNVKDLSSSTINAIREWFYDYAREDLSTCSDSELINTFSVTIEDERVLENDARFEVIRKKIENEETLSEQEEHLYSAFKIQGNRITKNNKVKVEALRFFLSDRVGQSVFSTFEHTELYNIIFAILNFPYGVMQENKPDYTELDVYLNDNGHNKKHETFTANIKTDYLVSRFGGCDVFDIKGQAFMSLGKYRSEIAPYFYLHLAELKLFDNFDFSKDKRITTLSHYWIGLH